MAAFWCFCKESTSLHVTRGTDIYSGFLLVLYNNITSFFNITIFFSYFTSIILTIHTWYSITCSCFTRVLVIALAFTCLLYSFACYFTCCFALFILLNIRSCRVSFLWLRSAPLHVFGERRRDRTCNLLIRSQGKLHCAYNSGVFARQSFKFQPVKCVQGILVHWGAN